MGVQDTHGCDFGLNQSCRLPGGDQIWPISAAQQPEVVHTAEAFLEVLLFQPHLGRVVVLPNGIQLLGQQESIPASIRQAVGSSSTMRGFFERLDQGVLGKFRARLWHYGARGAETEIRRGGGDSRRSLRETLRALREREERGAVPRGAPLYLSELRWCQKVRHPLAPGELVKTATNCDVYDCTPLARRMPLWERSEGGIFVGEAGTGSGLHVDQCLWSNVGRNWCGFKLFALWPWTERCSIIEDAGKGTVFHMPLSERDVGMLRRAKKVALIRPGDVWVFSGGQPHSALCVGDGLSITAYESLVPAHPDAVGLLVRSNCSSAHSKTCWMEDEDLDELYEDVVDAIQRSLRDPGADVRLRSRLQACAREMRDRGDSYCQELWEQEDRGERRRRRDEEDDNEAELAGDECSCPPQAKKYCAYEGPFQ